MIKKYKDRGWLEQKYHQEQLSSIEMAEICGCSSSSIQKWLKRHGIKTRTSAEAAANKYDKVNGEKVYTDPEWLRTKYWDEQLSLAAIGEIAGTTDAVIRNWMLKHNIPTRSLSEALEVYIEREGGLHTDQDWLQQKYWDEGLTLRQMADLSGCESEVSILYQMQKHGIPRRSLEDIGREIAHGRLHTDKGWLEQRYLIEKKTIYEMAEESGYSHMAIKRWMKKYDIPIRSNSEASKLSWERGDYAGEKHPRWEGGLSNEPYPFEFNYRYKEMIRERDGRKCVLCGKTEEENGRRLSVHHTTYDKSDLDPRTKVSLCDSCHMKTNSNRSSWTAIFTKYLYRKPPQDWQMRVIL